MGLLTKTLFVALVAMSASDALACTTVRLGPADGSAPLVAKSYDWDDGAGRVFVNPRGLVKTAFHLFATGEKLSWVSSFGSVTFNQYGREMPNGGINEAGLVVEVMWLNQTEYPAGGDAPVVSELQWVQYALDRFSSTDELVAAAKRIRVAPIHGRIHYLACDAKGACATFEYLDGGLVVHSGDTLAAPALTNHPYQASVEHLRRNRAPRLSRRDSLSRFHRAASASRAGDVDEVDEAFGFLDTVRAGDYTKWQIVYDVAGRSVHFRTRDAKAIKTIALRKLAFDCAGDVRSMSMDSAEAGDAVARLIADDGRANLALVSETLGRLGSGLGDTAAHVLASYPKSMRCLAPSAQ